MIENRLISNLRLVCRKFLMLMGSKFVSTGGKSRIQDFSSVKNEGTVTSPKHPGGEIVYLYRSIIESVESGIVTVDTSGTVNYINAAGEKFFGLNRVQVLNRQLWDIKSRNLMINRLPSVFTLLEDVLVRGVCYDGIELDGMLNGTKSVFNISAKMLKDRTGLPVGAFLILRDHSINRMLEDQVQRNECLSVVGQLAAGITHEIRNPLQSIKGFVQLLQEKNCNQQKIQVYAEVITGEIERINGIITEFLMLSRPAAAVFAPGDLNHLVQDVVLLMQSEAQLHQVRVETVYGKRLPLILLDQAQIKQVLINLFYNALGAMPEGGILKITTWYDFHFQEVKIRISDSGTGMDDATLRQIAEPFFTTKEEGTGLGLPVSYRIVQSHGGRIEVSSAVNQGTTFTIVLPGPAILKKTEEGFSENK